MSSENFPHAVPDDAPFYRAPYLAEEIPAFCARFLDFAQTGPEEEEFTFEGVDFEATQGVWFTALSTYTPEEDTPSIASEIAAGASPTGPDGNPALLWSGAVQTAMCETWGDPMIRTPRFVGTEQAPEGILDVLMNSVGVDEAQMWDRGDLWVVLLTDWAGEPAASTLAQILLVLPREYAMGGLSVFADEEDSIHEFLMNSEQPMELRRRAWILGTMFGEGEVRLRDTPIDACRYSLQANTGVTSVFTFADDGRALLLINDPKSTYAEEAARQLTTDLANQNDARLDDDFEASETSEQFTREGGVSEAEGLSIVLEHAEMVLTKRLLTGIPEDLLAGIAARGETRTGQPSEHSLAFRTLGDEVLPVISGAFWFDGSDWHTSAGLMELSQRNGYAIDDYGFDTAVRKPFKLGGTFNADNFVGVDDEERRGNVERLIADCPYPEQERPSPDDALGYAIPRGADFNGMIDQIEVITEASWDRNPEDAKWGDRTFQIGGRSVRAGHDGALMHGILANADPWNSDNLKIWSDAFIAGLESRWGTAFEMTVDDPQNGSERRTPVTRVMRGMGIRSGPMWWVNGVAVVVVAGQPDPSYGTDPQVVIVIAQADALLPLMRGTGNWELRNRFRGISNLAAIAAGEQPRVDELSWNGPKLVGSVIADSAGVVPLATRGRMRTADHQWVWHFCHDGRALLMSYAVDAAENTPEITFADQQALFSGVPSDLLSLVINQDSGGFYETITRPDGLGEIDARAGQSDSAGGFATESDASLAAAQTLPKVLSVFFYDDGDWQTSAGMLRRARAEGIAETAQFAQAVDEVVTDLESSGIDGVKVDGIDVGGAEVDGAEVHSDAETPKAPAVTVNPLKSIYSESLGVPQLQWALHVGWNFKPASLADLNYSSFVFEQPVTPDEAELAFASIGTAPENCLTGSMNQLMDAIVVNDGFRNIRDLALSNPDPKHRRDIVLWLLEETPDMSMRLSYLSSFNVLFDNRTLNPEDALLVRRLIACGADYGVGILGAVAGGHPLVQLCNRDLPGEIIDPIASVLIEQMSLYCRADPEATSEEAARSDVSAAMLPDGRSLLQYVTDGVFPHAHSRDTLLEMLQEANRLQDRIPEEV